MAEKFTYSTRLKSGEIRLLRVHPGEDNEFLKCDLKVHIASDVQNQYSALSYCWGSTSLTEHIICNDADLAITSSLYTALWQHRALGNTSPLWADAICINQNDLDEKTAQVRRIRHVYEQAKNVIIWIGEKQKDDVRALDLCKQLASIPAITEAEPFAETQSASTFFDFEAEGLPPLEHDSWTSLFLLLSRPWFFRTWIIQEFLVNAQTVLRCGDVEMAFETLLNGTRVLLYNNVGTRMQREAGRAQVGYHKCRMKNLKASNVLAFGTMKRLRHEGRDSLFWYLVSSRLFEATDPRDRIFSLIGLGSGIDQHFVDYRHSLPFVIANLACEIIENLPKIDNYLLTSPVEFVAWSHVFRTEWSKSNIPSWAPNFSKSKSRGYAIPFWIRSAFSSTLVEDDKLGSGVWRIDRSPSPDDGKPSFVLHTRHRQFDVVQQTFQLPFMPTMSADDGVRYYGSKAKFLQREDDHLTECMALFERLCPHHSPSEVEEIFWRTLLCNHTFSRTLTTEDWPAFQAARKWLRTADDTDHAETLARAPFLSAVGEIGLDRALFVSEGRRLGMAPSEAKPGDQVHFFLGSQFPLVLRQRSEQFELVGDCYLHGAMDGEAHDDLSRFADIEII